MPIFNKLFLLKNHFNKQAKLNEIYFRFFGWFLIITYPGYYFYNQFFAIPHGFELPFFRLFIAFLGIYFVIYQSKYCFGKKYVCFIWYFTLIAALPFFFFFMLLQNPDSNIWQINCLFGLILLTVFVNIYEFLLLFLIGAGLSYVITLILNPNFIIPSYLTPVIQTYFELIIYFLIYSQKKKRIELETIQNLSAQSGAIAHEMRTPLANVLMSSSILKKSTDELQKLINQPINEYTAFLKNEINEITEVSNRLSRIAKSSQNLINLLLANLKQDLNHYSHSNLSMADSLNYILEEFAFKPKEQAKVHINVISDFKFQGNLELITHIFFNLLKNSLYFIHAARKGEIFITIDQNEFENKIIFKDTGPGIAASQLPHLFKPFYSQRPHGTGIGLSFCKKAVENMNGRIEVQSILGEHTTFTIRLPKIKDALIE